MCPDQPGIARIRVIGLGLSLFVVCGDFVFDTLRIRDYYFRADFYLFFNGHQRSGWCPLPVYRVGAVGVIRGVTDGIAGKRSVSLVGVLMGYKERGRYRCFDTRLSNQLEKYVTISW